MIVGILKEIKTEENRVSMTPAGAEVIKDSGHTVLVEKSAGIGSGFEDTVYIEHSAEIVSTPGEIFERADMVMHVKEPLPPEYDLIREDQIVFTYLHLAAAEKLTNVLLKSGSIDIAYETIQKEDGSFNRYRLRNHPERRRFLTAADPDERSGWQDGHSAGSEIS